MRKVVLGSPSVVVQDHQVLEVRDSPLPPSVSELTLLYDLAGVERVVETQVAALKASKLQKFLRKIVSAFR